MSIADLDVLRATLIEARMKIDIARTTSDLIPLGGYWSRLPVELCSIIMELVVTTSDHDLRPKATVTMCLVSRDWYNIALGTPRIWATVIVNADLWSTFYPSLVGASTWLARSKAVPVYLDITLPLGFGSLAKTTGMIVLGLISQHLYHCMQIDLTIYGGVRLADVMSHLQGEAPLLRGLHIQRASEVEEWGVRGAQPAAGTLFGDSSPPLTAVTIPSLNLDWPSSPLLNLEVLRVANRGPVCLRRLVALFEMDLPKLVELDLSNFAVTAAEYTAHLAFPVVTNASIKTLTLRGESFGDATLLLDKVDLPNLLTLTIIGHNASTREHPLPLSTWPFTSLHSLAIEDDVDDLAGLQSLLNRMPELRTARLHNLNWLDILNRGWDEDSFVVFGPRLAELICCPNPDWVIYDNSHIRAAFTMFLLLRRELACADLEKLTFPFLGMVHDETVSAFQEILPRMKIEVSPSQG